MVETIRTSIESDPRFAALRARDRAADGSFFYAVATTGVYCRPSCASRPPRPENVRFFDTREAAEAAGFRPCKRCKPHLDHRARPHAAAIAAACRRLESDGAPDLNTLARQAGLSVFHFHRIFKAATGVTPKQYASAHRARRLRTGLTREATVTEAIYDAGYNSNGRFYAESNDLLGMTPSTYKSGGKRADIAFAVGECSLGSILVARSARGVCAILLGDDPQTLAKDLQDRFPQANLTAGDAEFEKLIAQVVGFVESPAAGLDLPLDVRGTAFQQRVWQALRKIPAGTRATYSEIASRIGSPKSVRAVAQACAANALAVAIPCHRVVRSDGALSGYRWGVERKQALLDREAR
jgi:AraC family transcriptional regulator of adaptative response/methylated-DNA-[protein]-cysteine methyltransferase